MIRRFLLFAPYVPMPGVLYQQIRDGFTPWGVLLFASLIGWKLTQDWLESKRVYEMQQPDFDRLKRLEGHVQDLLQADRLRGRMF